MNHHIQKQQFILTIRKGIDAFSVQHAASRFLRQGLLPVLERIFDELSDENEVIHLDHIVIDLGVIPESVLQNAVVDEDMYRLLKQEFRAALEQELSSRPGAIIRVAESVLQRWWFYMERGRLPWNADGFGEGDYRRVLEQLAVDFVQITRLRNELVEGSAFLTRVAAQHSGWFLENLVAVLVSSRQEGLAGAVTRAVEVHRVIEAIYRQWTYESSRWLSSMERRQQQEASEGLSRWVSRMSELLRAPVHERRSIIWQRLLAVAARRRDEFVRGDGVQILLQDIPEPVLEILVDAPEFRGVEDPLLHAMRRSADRRRRDEPPAGRVHPSDRKEDIPEYRDGEETLRTAVTPQDPDANPAFTKERPAGGTGSIENEQTKTDHRPKDDLPDSRSGQEGRPSSSAEPRQHTDEETTASRQRRTGTPDSKPPTTDIPEQPSASTAPRPEAPESLYSDQDPPASTVRPAIDVPGFHREQATEEGIYLSHAGLVLVHPFLSTLFHRLHLWNGSGFASLEARQKAIFLLHFLATGERTAPEYVLVFPKMLCGYALDMPVPGEMTLSDEECDEALVLLENVIMRWDKLGNTSPQGLREGFLQRRGKLSDKNGRLSLVLESSALDVLLDFLPWNISLVKMPWLRDIIYVEWR